MPAALIVAHGSPSDPVTQDRAMVELAAAVQDRAPGWRVAGATLAAAGSLEAALREAPVAVVYPFFMAEGWFTRTTLPRRLAAAGAAHLRQLPCFGHAPELPRLTARAAMDGAEAAGLDPRRTALLLAAHGSEVSRASAEGARAMASLLGRMAPFRAVLTGFVEEAPHIDDVARGLGPAICLPFFALRAGHVAGDVPDALDRAGFRGPLLPAIGQHEEVPAVIAAALSRAG
jgi:sirohydrochlorin ferrochelatase